MGTALREFSVFCPLVGFRFRESPAGDGGEEVKEGRVLISLLPAPCLATGCCVLLTEDHGWLPPRGALTWLQPQL